MRLLPDVVPMRLAALIEAMPVRLLAGSEEVLITDVVEDSRQAGPGSLFVARPGLMQDGRQFIADAVAAGAAAILTDRIDSAPSGVTVLIADDVPLAAALLADRFHRQPSRSLKLIGVTGTNGKTTTAHLIHHLLNSANHLCGLIGTVRIDDGATIEDAALTTPPAIALSGMLRRMVDHQRIACVMEVSSHALKQQRTAAQEFNIAVFTNISGDHLDYHQTMDDYVACKARLFVALPREGSAVINLDDPAASAMIRATSASILTCSLSNPQAACRADIRRESITAVDVSFIGPWGEMPLRLPLCGRHNVMNALQAAAVTHLLGLSRDAIHDALMSAAAPPGRLQPVTTPDHPFAVYVDYAHTDDALDNVLRALRPLVPAAGKLRVVFGCGGDRDRTKRPRMAAVAAGLADEIIITSDNPRTEDPAAIVEEVHRGIPADKRSCTTCIVDRRQAIAAAIESAGENDVILIAGKGHETYQIIGTERYDFDDRTVAAEALAASCRPPLVQQ